MDLVVGCLLRHSAPANHLAILPSMPSSVAFVFVLAHDQHFIGAFEVSPDIANEHLRVAQQMRLPQAGLLRLGSAFPFGNRCKVQNNDRSRHDKKAKRKWLLSKKGSMLHRKRSNFILQLQLRRALVARSKAGLGSIRWRRRRRFILLVTSCSVGIGGGWMWTLWLLHSRLAWLLLKWVLRRR
jgi:hypothetical protein